MRAIRSKDTIPEMVVRRLAHALGYRFRLYHPDLPGKPDIVFAGRRKVVFVHGCFWHGHDCRRGDVHPKTNPDYWREKIERNKKRDAANRSALDAAGWQIMTVWECETKPSGKADLSRHLKDFLGQ